MEGDLPFGYQKHKRPHNQMDMGRRSASPVWGFASFAPYRDVGRPVNHHEPASQPPRPRRYAHTPQHDFFSPPPSRVSEEPSPTRATPSPPSARAPAANPPSRNTHSHSHSPASSRTASVEATARPHMRHAPEHSSSAHEPHPHRAGLHLPHGEPTAPHAPRRFAGDGLDLRRPAGMNTGGESARVVDVVEQHSRASMDDHSNHIDLSGEDDDVIDLTADDMPYGTRPAPQHQEAALQQNRRRLPQGMDIIINLDNGDEEWQVAAAEPPSPEIQFMGSRRLDPPPPARRESVEFVRVQPLSLEEARQRQHAELDRAINAMTDVGNMNDRFVHLRAQVDRTLHRISLTRQQFHRGPVPPPARPGGRIEMGAFAVPAMDFELVGFDMGMGGNRVPEPPPPTYEAPPQAPIGYTRSPQEEDVLACPNCGDQLCEGEEEVKRQVWLIKGCGHVYCGECTTNRSVKRSAKGKEKQTLAKTRPFKECVVDDCGKRVTSSKAMIQIFL